MNYPHLLELVEGLASHPEAEMVSLDVARKRRVTKREKILVKVITDIYCAVHANYPLHSCHDVHSDWRKHAEELYKQVVEV